MAELSALSTELIKKGWKQLEDVEPVLPGMGGNVEYVSFLTGEEEFVSIEQLKRRAIIMRANLGQSDAQWLVDRQEMLSECPEDVRYLLFPGTVWEHLNDGRLCPYLYRTGKKEKEWDIYVFWMDFGFSDEHIRLVRLAQVTSP